MNIDANGDLFGTTSLDERRHFGEFRLGDQELAVRLNTGGFALCSTLRGTYGGYVEAIPPKAQGRGAPSKSHTPTRNP